MPIIIEIVFRLAKMEPHVFKGIKNLDKCC